jgi:hypothetical protein
MHGESGTEDPVEILRVLPEERHRQFRTEYGAAVEQAHDPHSYRRLTELLRLWRLRAAAYSDPGYRARLARAGAEDPSDEVTIEKVVGSWPHR